jgi:glycosyltransferase involved in cell wall biosynthesis
MNGVSVLILTKNEEHDLGDCLKSVAWSDDVHVLDSGSDDATASIARANGARVHTRAFDNYAAQRNAGLGLPFRHDWILSLDADERVPRPLADEIAGFVAAAPPTVVAARIRRRDLWSGHWLRRVQISPYFLRLTRKGRTHYERAVNEVLVVDGEIRDLGCHFDHYPFSKGLDHWIAKHNVYSTMEAALICHDRAATPSWRTALFARDFNQRRLHQKEIFYRMPARPLVKFLYLMLVRRAFLDGVAGLRYAVLQSIYEYFIVLKTKEIRDSRAREATAHTSLRKSHADETT